MNPILINNVDLAKKPLVLEGELNHQQLPRLIEISDPTHATDLQVKYHVQGGAEVMGYPAIALRIHAVIPVLCQRCIQGMNVSLDLNFQYAVSDDADTQDAEFDDVDFLEPDRAMNLTELIEDEVIAALPIAPAHKEVCVDLTQHADKKESPFAALKALKKN